MQVKKQQLEPDKEQLTDSKLGKKYVKGVYCHLACKHMAVSFQCMTKFTSNKKKKKIKKKEYIM